MLDPIHLQRKLCRELQLQQQWSRVRTGTSFLTVDERCVVIESCGIWNTEQGPDFLNARIVLDGEVVIGDIEIHRRASDWFSHKHEGNPWYNHVVLHVIAEPPKGHVPHIPTVLMAFDEPNFSLVPSIEPGACAAINQKRTDLQITSILEQYGLERFILKSELISRLITYYGRNYVASYLLFDAAGYKNNRDAFKHLFHLWQRYDSKEQKGNVSAMLWGLSGLLSEIVLEKKTHEKFHNFIQEHHVNFGKLRKIHFNPPTFIRSGCRPTNSPERRLSALIKMLEQCNCEPFEFWKSHLLGYQTPAAYVDDLLSMLQLSDPLFDHFWNFKTRSEHCIKLQGESRALDIALNVVITILHADAMLEGDLYRIDFLRKVWCLLPATQKNEVIQTAIGKCFGAVHQKRAMQLLKNCVYQQGLTHQFTYFCDHNQSVCHTCRMLNADL